MYTTISAEEFRTYLQSRLTNAKRIGRPAHIARCEARLAGFETRMNARLEREVQR